MAIVDIFIRNGHIVDGTSNPWFAGDVAIRDGRICGLGKLREVQARETINANGMVVCPGFIDIHGHADIALLSHPRHEPKIMQGVTTEVFSNCGIGFAPVTPEALQILRDNYASLFGDDTGVTWDWTSVADYLSRFTQKGIAANIAYLIPHASVRISVMGMAERPATRDEIKAMQKLVRQSMEEGALGFSSGLWYVPLCYADIEESIALCQVVAEYGGIYSIHMRNYRERIIECMNEALTIAEATGVPVQISHLAAVGENKGKSVEYLRIIDEARARGLDIMCDAYPYLAGSTILQAMLPQWAGTGGPTAILSRLHDPQIRSRIIDEMSSADVDWTQAYVCSVKTETNRSLEGQNFADIASAHGVSVAELICDLLVEEELEVCFLVHTGHEPDLQTIMSHPAHVVGSDGLHLNGKMHPRLYGTFVRYLGRYVRELKVLTLENAIRKMTSLPAQRLGLQDRGILKVGMAADVVILDPQTVGDSATYEEPRQYPTGIPYVIVNGQIVKHDNKHTGILAGHVLRENSQN